MISTFLTVLVAIIILAACLWVLDLVLTALFNRLGVPDDIKRAARAVIALIVFLVVFLWVLKITNVLPAGWW